MDNKGDKNIENDELKPILQTTMKIILVLLYILFFVFCFILSFLSAFYFETYRTSDTRSYLIIPLLIIILLLNYKFLKWLFPDNKFSWVILLFAYLSVFSFVLFYFVLQFIRF